jgi:uncharacterized RDD family membrane protein YckC
MTPPSPNEPPPPLPPPIPATPVVPPPVTLQAAAPATDAAASAPPPPAAPLHWRTLAYLCDWLVATLAIVALFKWVLTDTYSEALPALKTWLAQVWESYLAQIQSRNRPEDLARTLAVIRAMPESVAEFSRLVVIVQTLFFWGYFFVSEFFSHGTSLGKRIFNLRVVNTADFAPPNVVNSLLRSGWKSIFFCSANPLLLLIGAIDAHVPLFNRRRQSWHDMITHTEVIDASLAPYIPPPETDDDTDSFFP